MAKLLKKAFETGYTDEDYMEAFKGFFKEKDLYELEARGIEFIDYSDSIFYFKKNGKNGKGNTKTS